MYQNQRPPGQSGPPDQLDQAAIVLAVAAAFLWANPVHEMTADWFRETTVRNYGTDMLDAFEWAYWIFLHVVIFALSRVAFRWALVALVTAIGYRLALSF